MATLLRRSFPTLALAAALALAACHGGGEATLAPAAPRAAAAPIAAQADAAIAEGDRAFTDRADPARLAAALAAYGRAAALRPADPAAELRVARAEGFRALAAGGADRGREASDASARAAERALRVISPSWAVAIDRGDDPAASAALVEAPGAEALYWLALGTWRGAQAQGYAAVLAVKDAALAMMARAAELDERLDAAGPHRALGAWRAALPLAAGGGAAASRAHFDRARALAPDDLLARVAEAESYAVLVQDEPLFERLLAEVLAADAARDPARAPENAVAKRRAKELQDRKARLF